MNYFASGLVEVPSRAQSQLSGIPCDKTADVILKLLLVCRELNLELATDGGTQTGACACWHVLQAKT